MSKLAVKDTTSVDDAKFFFFKSSMTPCNNIIEPPDLQRRTNVR